MKDNLTISVCMTVFSFSQYLEEQLASILNQTKKIDELVIVEDYSGKDSPKKYIEEICSKKTIKLIYKMNKKNLGPAESFRDAILESNGDVIFLSDHDDIWAKDRVARTLPFHKNNDFIVVNGQKFTNSSQLTFKKDHQKTKIYYDLQINIFSLIIKNEIIGATTSFRGNIARLLASKISFYPMHDWILVILFLLLNKKIKFINESLIKYRRHGDTFTDNKKNSLLQKCKFRLSILYTIVRVFMFKLG